MVVYSDRKFLILLASATVCTVATAFVVRRQQPNAFRHMKKGMLHTKRMMKKLPDEVVQYSQVPRKGMTFTATSIPKGLLKNHSTKAGTWGVIRILQGKLKYQINEPAEDIIELDSTIPGIIEPQIHHQVAPLTDDVEFVVEFYRLPNTGPVDEKREGL